MHDPEVIFKLAAVPAASIRSPAATTYPYFRYTISSHDRFNFYRNSFNSASETGATGTWTAYWSTRRQWPSTLAAVCEDSNVKDSVLMWSTEAPLIR